MTRDLEEMKAKGLSGCILMDYGVANFGPNKWGAKTVIGETEIKHEPTKEYAGGKLGKAPTALETWSPEWRSLVRFSSLEAGRLGLDLGIYLGPAGCAAPWVTPEYAQQELVWNQTPLSSTGKVELVLPLPGGGQSEKKNRGKADADLENAARTGYYRDVAVLAIPAQGVFPAEKVINLSAKVNSAGHLQWDAPAGNWVILRFGQRPTGKNRPGELYLDHLSAEALDQHWAHTAGLLLSEMSPAERKAFKTIGCDSWECGTPTWTKKFPDEFAKRRGYDLLRFLPVLAGRTVGSTEESARFQSDYRLTIGDLIADNHYGHQRELAHANGLFSTPEAAGPHQIQADWLKSVSRGDVAMGEFWMPSIHRPTPPERFFIRDAASAAHIYGMNRVFAESFTSVGPHWEESPFLMKAAADQAFCDGLNWICFHTFTHHPNVSDVPGLTHSAGTHFDPTVTWWNQAAPFVTYLARCSYMLQQGLFVADVVVFQGDGIKDGKKPSKPGANPWGDTMKNPPPALGAGYDFDKLNTEALLTRMSVKEGRLVLPDGMSSRALVLPDQLPLSLEVLQKVSRLVAAGATVIGNKPTAQSWEAEKAQPIVNQLWGGAKPGVIQNSKVRDVLTKAGIGPDFECTGVSPKGVIDFIHRQMGDREIYFVTSRWQPVERITASFRVTGKQPELWDPITGTIRDLPDFREENGRTLVPLELPPCGSAFIVFDKPINGQPNIGQNWTQFKPLQEIGGPWKVAFDPKWGGPAEANFDNLIDWALRPEDGIKYYSGKATYRQSFDLTAAAVANKAPIFLDLGQVREVAAVRLNGKDLGVLWAKPFQVEITSALKPAGNNLEIDVVNLWPNRLIGDEFLPENQRFTRTNIRKFTKATQLLPSGLLGPVRLLQ